MINRKLQFKSMLLCCEFYGQIAHFFKGLAQKQCGQRREIEKAYILAKRAKSAVNWRAPVHLKSITQPLVFTNGIRLQQLAPELCWSSRSHHLHPCWRPERGRARGHLHIHPQKDQRGTRKRWGTAHRSTPTRSVESIIHPCCSWSGPAASKLQHTHIRLSDPARIESGSNNFAAEPLGESQMFWQRRRVSFRWRRRPGQKRWAPDSLTRHQSQVFLFHLPRTTLPCNNKRTHTPRVSF